MSYTSAIAESRRFWFRVGRFLAPLGVIGFLFAGVALRSGEFLPVRFIAWLQTFRHPFIFLPKFSDHTFRLKLDATRSLRPDVLVLGSSRANQWRSAMFRPITFYNAGNSISALHDFTRFLEELGDYNPRVIIFSIDYFTFSPQFERVYREQSKDDIGNFGSPEQMLIIKRLFNEIIVKDLLAARDPMALLFQQDPSIPALGLSAMRLNTGFRIDGSYQYGGVVDTGYEFDVPSVVARIQDGKEWPIVPASRLEPALLRKFEQFTELARRKGIALVGVTMPFLPSALKAIERSPLYEGWRQFQSQQTKDWISSQGVVYFDFTKIEDFAGRADEFVDPYHPGETAYLRMLLTMLREPRFRALCPEMDSVALAERLKQASPFQVYRDEF
jgi:hypothetical protein